MHRQTTGAHFAMLTATLVLAACNGGAMKPNYSKAVVTPVVVSIPAEGQLRLRYRVFPESSYYSNGVDYERIGDVTRVVIRRCAVGEACEPMAKSRIPLDDRWEAEVDIPYEGGAVVLVHADAEERIHP